MIDYYKLDVLIFLFIFSTLNLKIEKLSFLSFLFKIQLLHNLRNITLEKYILGTIEYGKPINNNLIVV